MNDSPEQPEPGSAGAFHTLQPHRDLETNWSVDLAKNLEEYLLKICSGEIAASSSDLPQLTVNFAEAALLLQGSAQVYSRKVEYLYSLVLNTLDFISNKSSQEQATDSSAPKKTKTSRNDEDGDDTFWGLDDIPVEPKSLLDDLNGKDTQVNYLVRPPANLVVLEGDCLDAIGDAGELESYLLATNDLFRDFILLDSCDVEAVNEFLGTQPKSDNLHSAFRKGSTWTSKSRKSFLSPTRRSGGTAQKPSAQKNQDANVNQSPPPKNGFETNDFGGGSSPPVNDFPEDEDGYFDRHDGFPDDSDDDDDPWKPLNPHEPGNLKVKPFKKGKASRKTGRNLRKQNPLVAEFPIARMDGPISAELIEIWEAKCFTSKEQDEPHSPSLFEKLRESLVHEGSQGFNAFPDAAENNVDNGYDSEDAGNDPPDFDMPEKTYEHDDVPQGPSQPHEDNANIHMSHNDGYEEEPDTHASLEDLCRSHLDSLLASLAETEKQTEMAARISSWKKRIDENLEEQDKRPPFDIHEYGGKVLEKLHQGEAQGSMSFTDVVKGQSKHEVARTFSALLQLVNNGDVGLEKNASITEPICYTAENPFHVNLLENEKPSDEFMSRITKKGTKKRAKSPIKAHTKGEVNKDINSPVSNGSSSTCRSSVKLGKAVATRRTPEGKKRRKSRFVSHDNGVE